MEDGDTQPLIHEPTGMVSVPIPAWANADELGKQASGTGSQAEVICGSCTRTWVSGPSVDLEMQGIQADSPAAPSSGVNRGMEPLSRAALPFLVGVGI